MAEKKKRALPDNDRDWTPVDDLAWLGRLERLVRKVPKGAMARMHDYASELLAGPLALPVGPMEAAQATQEQADINNAHLSAALCFCDECTARRNAHVREQKGRDAAREDAQANSLFANGPKSPNGRGTP